MKQKVGTVLDRSVVERAKAAASSEGKSLAAYIQEAIVAHLARRHGSIRASQGMYRLSPIEVHEILQSSPLDEDS